MVKLFFFILLILAVIITAFLYKTYAAGKENINEVPAPYSEDEIKEMILVKAAGGFDSRDEIISEMLQMIEEENSLTAEFKEEIPQLVDTALRHHQEEQKKWIGKTDCDRLDLAFSVLEKNGIVARQNFTDCQTCGNEAIWDEINEKGKATTVQGYTYYHMQDTEGAVQDGDGLFLSYGSLDNTDEQALAIGKIVVDTLKKEGLAVEWNGTIEERIFVKMDWKRRRL